MEYWASSKLDYSSGLSPEFQGSPLGVDQSQVLWAYILY